MAPTTTASVALAATIAPTRGAPGRGRSDRALVAGALAGEQAALDALFQRHWPAAYRVALLIVRDHAAAEDVAQEAFVAAVGRLERFDRRRPFAPWLLKITANRALDWSRARGRRREVAVPRPIDLATAADEARDCSDELLRALAALGPEQRAVVVLRHLLEWTPGEIARALELPRGTVNSRLRRGLDALQRGLEEERG